MLGELVEHFLGVSGVDTSRRSPTRGREHLQDELGRDSSQHDSGVGQCLHPGLLDPVQDPLVHEPQPDLARRRVAAGLLAVGEELLDLVRIVGRHEAVDQLEDERVPPEHRREARRQPRLDPEHDEQLDRLVRVEILELPARPQTLNIAATSSGLRCGASGMTSRPHTTRWICCSWTLFRSSATHWSTSRTGLTPRIATSSNVSSTIVTGARRRGHADRRDARSRSAADDAPPPMSMLRFSRPPSSDRDRSRNSVSDWSRATQPARAGGRTRTSGRAVSHPISVARSKSR